MVRAILAPGTAMALLEWPRMSLTVLCQREHPCSTCGEPVISCCTESGNHLDICLSMLRRA